MGIIIKEEQSNIYWRKDDNIISIDSTLFIPHKNKMFMIIFTGLLLKY